MFNLIIISMSLMSISYIDCQIKTINVLDDSNFPPGSKIGFNCKKYQPNLTLRNKKNILMTSSTIIKTANIAITGEVSFHLFCKRDTTADKGNVVPPEQVFQEMNTKLNDVPSIVPSPGKVVREEISGTSLEEIQNVSQLEEAGLDERRMEEFHTETHFVETHTETRVIGGTAEQPHLEKTHITKTQITKSFMDDSDNGQFLSYDGLSDASKFQPGSRVHFICKKYQPVFPGSNKKVVMPNMPVMQTSQININGEINFHLSCKLDKERNQVRVSQPDKIKELLKKAGITGSNVQTIIGKTHIRETNFDGIDTNETEIHDGVIDESHFRQLFGVGTGTGKIQNRTGGTYAKETKHVFPFGKLHIEESGGVMRVEESHVQESHVEEIDEEEYEDETGNIVRKPRGRSIKYPTAGKSANGSKVSKAGPKISQ